MSKDKIISFIIPNVNTKNYLKWCYNSIRKNLGYRHEIVLLDDGSTDDSWEWIEEISKKDHNVKIHKNYENIGIAYSYNKAVEYVTAGGKLETIKAKYALSKEVEDSLTTL